MKLRLRLLLVGVSALLGLLHVHCGKASDLTAVFDAANKFYEEGKYVEAATAYQKLIEGGQVSDTLYFNLGNAFYKAGQSGRAIAAYRQAERLSPRDPGLRFNLQFVRKKVNGNDGIPRQWWQRGLAKLTLNEWTLLTAVASWLWFLLLALTEWRRELKRALRSYAFILGVSCVLLTVCLGASVHDYYFDQPAIVVAREVVVRRGPFDTSASAYLAQDGTELTVLGKKNDWLEVSDTRQRTGWLKRTEVLVLKPA